MEVAGTRVEETTVLRAGQSVTVAAHEVTVIQAVEYRVDSVSSPTLTATAGVELTTGALVGVVAAAAALEMAKGLEYWKVAPVASPSKVILMP